MYIGGRFATNSAVQRVHIGEQIAQARFFGKLIYKFIRGHKKLRGKLKEIIRRRAQIEMI